MYPNAQQTFPGRASSSASDPHYLHGYSEAVSASKIDPHSQALACSRVPASQRPASSASFESIGNDHTPADVEEERKLLSNKQELVTPNSTVPLQRHGPNVPQNGPTQQENTEHFCRKKRYRVGASTISIVIITSLIVAAVIVVVVSIKGHTSRETQFGDVMKGDTILLYEGYSHGVTISKVFPDTISTPDINIFVTDCNNLVKHIETNYSLSRDYYFSSSDPTRVMSNTFYFELGSVMNFSLATINTDKGSSIALLMFDNDKKANDYIHSPAPSTRSQAIAEWEIDNLTEISFTPTYRSYYVPVFAPIVDGKLGVQLSYNITRVFYLHSDYIKYANCSLNIESCTLNLSGRNETCILAYSPAFQKVTLQINIMGNEEPGDATSALLISMYICIPLLIVSDVLCIILCIKCFRAVRSS